LSRSTQLAGELTEAVGRAGRALGLCDRLVVLSAERLDSKRRAGDGQDRGPSEQLSL
jgi:hypothetical protein